MPGVGPGAGAARATFTVLDVAGHDLQLDQQALFPTLTDDWLDRVDHG